jgi:hypothetical protein
MLNALVLGQFPRLEKTLLFIAVLAWIVTRLIDFFDWEQGVWRALMLLVVLIATPLLLRRVGTSLPPISQRLTRWLTWIWVILLIWHCVTFALHLSEPKIEDSATATLNAGTAMLHGGNPYTLSIDPEETASGVSVSGYKYAPLMPAFFMPLGLVLGDRGILVTNFLLDLAVTVLVMVLAKRISQNQTVALYAGVLYLQVSLVVQELYIEGDIDQAVVVPLLLALLWFERRPGWAGLAVGLSISTKLFPGVLFILCCLPGARRWRYSLGLLIGILPILFFLVESPQAFWLNIVQFISQRGTDSTSWLDGLPPLVGLLARAVSLCILLPMAIYLWVRRPTLLSRCAIGVMMVILVNLSSPVTHRNYMLWWIPLFAVVLGVGAFHMAREKSDRTGLDGRSLSENPY